MASQLQTNDPDPGSRKSIDEQISEFRKAPFQFNCLGLNCLGWIILLLIAAVVYVYTRR